MGSCIDLLQPEPMVWGHMPSRHASAAGEWAARAVLGLLYLPLASNRHWLPFLSFTRTLAQVFLRNSGAHRGRAEALGPSPSPTCIFHFRPKAPAPGDTAGFCRGRAQLLTQPPSSGCPWHCTQRTEDSPERRSRPTCLLHAGAPIPQQILGEFLPA